MEEQNTTNAEGQKEQPANNIGNGNKPETASLIDRADSVAKRMEEANKKAEEHLARMEQVLARQMLSGRAEAGTSNKSKEQTDLEKLEAEVKATLARYR